MKFASASPTKKTRAKDISRHPTLAAEYWEEVFAEPDPWQYSTSDYEKWKFELTLSLLPSEQIGNALEIACAEGHLTALLAPKVSKLLAVDISPTALARARARCSNFGHVRFEERNLADDWLPKNLDLIFVSEVLFYLPLDLLKDVAPRIARSLKVGGHLLVAHGNLISDDPKRTGFDWGHEFGALTIGKVFQSIDELALVRELRTPFFTIQLFRRLGRSKASKEADIAEIVEIPLPFDLELPASLERTLIWDGAVVTRAHAQATETVSQVPILMYHSIADEGPAELASYRTTPVAFQKQLQYLRRHGFHSITLHEWADAIAQQRPVAGRPIIITFDDAYRDFLKNACPALERADFTATVFAVTEKVGGLADWDSLPRPLELMDWRELREIIDRGMTVGSHTARHPNLTKLSATEVRYEGDRSRASLREQLGLDASLIAFPWGSSNRAARLELANCGYRIGVRSWGGLSPLNDDPLNLSRIEIGDDDLDSFIAKLSSEYEPVMEEEPEVSWQEDEEVSWEDGERDEISWEKEEISWDDNAEPVGFDTIDNAPRNAGNLLPTTSIDRFSVQPPKIVAIDPTSSYHLAARLDSLVGEFVKLQNQLLSNLEAPITLQKRLVSIFTLPVTGRIGREVRPLEPIVPEVAVSFEDTATVRIVIDPKADHTASPESHLNTLSVEFSGESEWFTLEIGVDWRDLSLAEQFQLSIYAQPSRTIRCDASLRLPRRDGPPAEIVFSSFELSSRERNRISSGTLQLPDFMDLDTSAKPHLLLFLDTSEDFSVVIHYLNIYFG